MFSKYSTSMLNGNKGTLNEHQGGYFKMETRKLTRVLMILFMVAFMIIGTTGDLNTEEVVVAEITTHTEDEVIVSGENVSGISKTLSDVLSENYEMLDSVSLVQNQEDIVGSGIVEEELTYETRFEEIPSDEIKYVDVESLNVRNGASADCDVIDVVMYGEELHVIGSMNIYQGEELIGSWDHIAHNGITGYVNASYLTDTPVLISLGTYQITYYCACAICCNVETGITASGEPVQAGVTIAADASIPFGTQLIIDGHTYTVQDRGGAIKGNHIDIYCNTHEEALQNAVHYSEVFMKTE